MRIGSSNVTVLVAGEGAAADSDESSPGADAVKVEAVREDITLGRFGAGSLDEASGNMSRTMRSRISSVAIPRSSPMPDKSLRVTGCGKHDQSGDKGGAGKGLQQNTGKGGQGKGCNRTQTPEGGPPQACLYWSGTKPVALARRVKAIRNPSREHDGSRQDRVQRWSRVTLREISHLKVVGPRG